MQARALVERQSVPYWSETQNALFQLLTGVFSICSSLAGYPGFLITVRDCFLRNRILKS